MSDSVLDVESVAHLARIALTPEETRAFADQIGRILEHIELLRRVDVSAVEPTAHANPVFNVLREDVPVEGLERDSALALAPRQAHHLIMVPKVVE